MTMTEVVVVAEAVEDLTTHKMAMDTKVAI